MKITWLTQGSFLFESTGTRILVDPYMSDCLESKGLKRLVEFPLSFDELKPDILICTHDHLDHLDPETVQYIAALYPEAAITGPISCYEHFRQLGIAEQRLILLERGKSVVQGKIAITPVLAIHSDPQAVGLVIQTADKKIYLSADSEYDDDLICPLTQNCELILICINGRLGNMSLDEALNVVKAVKPLNALPMHYGLFAENTVDPQPFIDDCIKNSINSFEMKPGGQFEL
ncbi:MAG: MBL fold metallo-hydrolase [Victivallaceae bacterium]|nr:MBL fold metallo-hydrolase [Victivallaceae bacterium]